MMIFTGYLAFGCIILLVLVVGGLFLMAGWWTEANQVATGLQFGIMAWGVWFLILLFLTALYLVFIGSIIRWALNKIVRMTRIFHGGNHGDPAEQQN
jgi:hypothetical protein